MPALPYNEHDIRRCLGYELEKGRSYQRRGAVSDLRADKGGQRLLADVQGTRRRPYHVFAEIRPGQRVHLTGRCSCPVAVDCKHVAAVLLEAMAHPPAGMTAGDPLGGPVADWLDRLRRGASDHARPAEEIVYCLDLPQVPSRFFTLNLRVVRILKSGTYGAERGCPSGIDNSMARYVQAEDRLIARLMRGSSWGPPQLPDDPEAIDLAMRRILATGRCRWQAASGPALALGPPRRARLDWRLDSDGCQRADIAIDDGAVIGLPAASPWYVDPEARLAGPLEFDMPRELVAPFLMAPPIDIAQAAALGTVIEHDFAEVPLPRPRADLIKEIRNDPPVLLLRLVNRRRVLSYWTGRAVEETADIAMLGFAYGEQVIEPASGPADIRKVEGGCLIVRRRNLLAERRAQQRLKALGLAPADAFHKRKDDNLYLPFAFVDNPSAWPPFVHEALPELEAEGWRIELEEGFHHWVVDGEGDWSASVSERGGWWFSLDLGIEVDGARVPLLPVLTDLLRRIRAADIPGGIDGLEHHGIVYGTLPDGRHIALPLERTKAILAALVELYHPEILSAEGALDISVGEATALAEIEAATRLRWLGGERLRALAARLQGFTEIEHISPPSGLQTELRGYQRSGLDWLQFLRAYELGGILADDMGLGKTVQTLAHLLVEKHEGRLDRPCLVVCPTSVLPNWCAEAARLAPELRVLSLHGPDRAARFCKIETSDLVLTTYALLPRDGDRLLAVEWHLAVLDEAQAIKNVTSKAAQLACRLIARHRLCLTGTPVENHLGELWSQFAFLTPGLLGDAKRFARVFRTPIEKHQDSERRSTLAARLKPLLLRRTKAVVAADLPPKSEIYSPLELSGPQRDLYETVRLAMHEKVREQVAAKGFARSRVVILDALLKLRQVCCDPRLVKLGAARRVSASAKLLHLMDMLPALIEDGRRVLLFSQFTSMLDLIKPELARAGIEFVELRGDTTDRAVPISRFQKGKAPLFLISLRAGGTGLNLTAADTVIHYDPWWNPAVEDQATDRAHRIGQDKAVLVYKLVTQGTVEERMIELQERKRALAAGILDQRATTEPMLNPADIERLFAPLA